MSRRVVIAEDEAIIRLDLKEILQDEGYDVVGETGRGDEAVDLVREHQPDLAILDVKMPGSDGLAAARAIRDLDIKVAVLILTAFSQRNLIDEARDAGVAAYLVKPFQRIELIPAIDQAMARCEQEWAIDAEARQVASDGDSGRPVSAEDKLETRRLVDGAKSVLMDRAGMSETEAFGFIQRTAMGTRSRMIDVARQVLEGSLAPSARPSAVAAQPPSTKRPKTPGKATATGGQAADAAAGDGAAASAPPAGPLILLDGMSLAFRAYFALPPDLATSAGVVTNAVHGFSSMVVNLVRDHHPVGLAVAFDLPGGTFRDDIAEDYKGGRADTPPDLPPQFDMIRALLGSLHIPVLEAEGFEADDVLATLATEARDRSHPVIIVTGDRDAYQLVEDPYVRVLYNRRGVSDYALYDEAGIEERTGVRPEKYPLLAAFAAIRPTTFPGSRGWGRRRPPS